MSGPDQSLPEVPLGIDPEVQLRIKALFEQPQIANTASRIFERTTNSNTVVSYSDATTAPPQAIIDTQTSNRGRSPSREPNVNMSQRGAETNQDSNEGTWHGHALWAPPPLPHPQAVSRFADPSKVTRSEISQHQIILDVLPRTHNDSVPSSPPPSSPTFFRRAVTYIGNYLKGPPDIIEYSDAEIKQKMQVFIEAQELFLSNANTKNSIIKVVAILTDTSPIGAGGRECGVIERPVEMRAKHKRVREIMRGGGCYVAEDTYGKEIKVALRELR